MLTQRELTEQAGEKEVRERGSTLHLVVKWKNLTPMDEDSGEEVRAEGGVGTGWRGAIGGEKEKQL